MPVWNILRTETGGFAIVYEAKNRDPFMCGEVQDGSPSKLAMLESWCIRESQPGDLVRAEGREYAMLLHGKEMVRA